MVAELDAARARRTLEGAARLSPPAECVTRVRSASLSLSSPSQERRLARACAAVRQERTTAGAFLLFGVCARPDVFVPSVLHPLLVGHMCRVCDRRTGECGMTRRRRHEENEEERLDKGSEDVEDEPPLLLSHPTCRFGVPRRRRLAALPESAATAFLSMTRCADGLLRLMDRRVGEALTPYRRRADALTSATNARISLVSAASSSFSFCSRISFSVVLHSL